MCFVLCYCHVPCGDGPPPDVQIPMCVINVSQQQQIGLARDAALLCCSARSLLLLLTRNNAMHGGTGAAAIQPVCLCSWLPFPVLMLEQRCVCDELKLVINAKHLVWLCMPEL